MICEICNLDFPAKEKHHIHSRSLGGTEDKSNKCFLCPNCHTLVHIGDIIIEGRFSSTAGPILIWRKKGEPSITGLPDPPVFIMGEQNL